MSAKFYKLRVIRLERLQRPETFYRKRPNLYVEVTLGDVVRRTGIIEKSSSPSWDEILEFSVSGDSTTFEIQLRRHSRVRSDQCVGLLRVDVNDFIEKCASGEASFDIQSSSLQGSSSPVAVITLHLEVGELITSVGKSIETAGEDVRRHGIEASERALDHTESIANRVAVVSGQGDLYQAVSKLLSRLDLFKQVMDTLSDIHPFVTIAWKVASALYTAVEHVFQVDKRIIELVRSMIDAFAFVQDVQALPRKGTSLQQPIEGLLKQTHECCLFIREYTGKGFLNRALDVDAAAKVDEFEQALSRFKQLIDSGLNLYTAVVSLRVSQCIDEMLLRQRLDPMAADGSDRPTCLSGTRTEVLNEIVDWMYSETTQNVFWLHGVAGSGKSTISTTIAKRLREMSRLGAFLLFTRGKSEPSSVIRTIAFKLALFDNSIASSILSETERNKDIASATLPEQFKKLLLQPLLAVAESIPGPIAVLLDALDECGTSEKRRPLMELLQNEFSKLPNIFRFLITSRRERDIDKSLSSHPEAIWVKELDYASVASQQDVLSYISTEMLKAVGDDEVEVPEDWNWDHSMSILGKAAGGLFIWASTAVKMVRESDSPFDQLECLLSDTGLLSSSGMDALYATVLRVSGIMWRSEKSKARFRKVLGLLLLSKVPISSRSMDSILGFTSRENSLQVLSRLRSVISFGADGTVNLFHASFADYLLSSARSSEPWFIDMPEAKRLIAERCFTVMKDLRFNMCDLESSFVSNDEVPSDRIKDCIPAHLEYTCLHWMQHLLDVPYTSDLLDQLSNFAHRRLLYWFEVLSLHKVFSRVAGRALRDAAIWAEIHDLATASFLRDASTLVSTFAPAGAHSVPHIYVSMLPLAKDDSLVAAHYYKRTSCMVQAERRGVKKPVMHLKVFEGHSDGVLSVAFSPGGTRVASASLDRTVRIWDLDSGETLMMLTGHSQGVRSVCYSPDGKHIVSGSSNGTLQVWDVECGELVLHPLEGHTKGITSVAFSSDGSRIASGSIDKTVIVWNVVDGQPILPPLTRHTGRVNSVSFSPSGARLVSGSNDMTIVVWDVDTGIPISEPFSGHSRGVNSAAFSPNGKHLVSGSGDMTIKIWDVESGNVISTLSGHKHVVTSVVYSPCGTRIASGSADNSMIVWDAECGQILSGPFKGHSHNVWSVAWSPDGTCIASGSQDKTVRIWAASTSTDELSTFTGHSGPIMSISLSSDGTRIASASEDKLIIVWDTKNGDVVLGPLLGHTGRVNCVAFSLDGSQLFSGSGDGTIRVWNTVTGDMVLTPLQGHRSSVGCIALSPDGSTLVSGSRSGTLKVWDAATGVSLSGPLHGHSGSVNSVAFSPAGKQLVSGSVDKTIRLWNTETWEYMLEPLTSHTGPVHSVCFSPDGKRIASGSADYTIIVWDAESGTIITGPFKGHTSWVGSVIFSHDGKYIISGSWDKTIRFWSAETGRCICAPFEGHASTVSSLALSTDGSRLISGSWDNTIRAWDVSDLLHPAADSGDNHTVASSHTRGVLSDWALGDNGWIQGLGGGHNLLLWIPPDIRPTLCRTRNTAIFSCEFLTKLDFTGAALGERWRECFVP